MYSTEAYILATDSYLRGASPIPNTVLYAPNVCFLPVKTLLTNAPLVYLLSMATYHM